MMFRQEGRCGIWTAAVFIVLLGAVNASEPSVERSRPFRMGFTAFPHDITPQAVEETRRFVRANADLIAHHIEGVPWTEALREEPFSKELLGEYESKRSMKPPGAKVYLAISPGRGDLKLPDKGAAPLAAELIAGAKAQERIAAKFPNIQIFMPDGSVLKALGAK